MSVHGFTRAALIALGRTYAGAADTPARAERVSIDVSLGTEHEVVALTLNGGALSWTCSCRKDACAHTHAALLLLAGVETPAPAGEREPASERERMRSSQFDMAAIGERGRPSQTRMAAVSAAPVAPAQPERRDTPALCEALSDLVTAAVRSGTTVGTSASVEEALARFVRLSPMPQPAGLSRWGGRLNAALAARDAPELARLLHAASRLADDLRQSTPSPIARARMLSWLGAPSSEPPHSERLTDATLIEIARERVASLDRSGIERRYLLNPEGGAIYCEERTASAAASLGPCPRQLSVWLSLVERSAPPARIRLLQYTVSPAIDSETWQRVTDCAQRDFESLAASYRESLTNFAGLCEPCVLLAPSALDIDAASPALTDAAGHALPLLCRDQPAVISALRDLLRNAQLQWISGRLLDRDGAIGFLPLGAAVLRHGRLCYARV